MTGKIFISAGILACLYSCTSEKVNISPISENITNINPNAGGNTTFGGKISTIATTSELSNLLSNAPQLNSPKVNKEVANLKNSLELYIYALEAQNKAGKERNIQQFEESYKKLQLQKTSLSDDEQDVLNRYLVQLKTRITKLEDISK